MRENGGDNRVGVGWRGGLRGQSEVVGALVVFAIIVGGAVLVASIGSTAITDSEETLSDQRAEKAMTQFSSKAGLVALQEADSQQINFATDQSEQFSVVEDTGWMNVTWTNQTTGYSEEVMNMTLGSLVYKGKDTRIAYQGGGVFRATETGGVMISPPEFHFRDGTLTLPAVNITGDSALGNSVTVTRSDVSRRFPTSGENSTNPLDNHVVTVTVKSEYYRGWGNYFEERTDGEVEYDDDEETATLLMVTPIELTEIKAASASLSASGEFRVTGNSAMSCSVGGGNDNIFTDSYNSSKSTDYCEQLDNGNNGNDGDLIYGGDINFESGTGGSGFCGEIRSGGTVSTQGGGGSPSSCGDGTGGQPMVFGNISYTDSCVQCSDAIVTGYGTDTKIDDIRAANAVDWYVNSTVQEIDNSATGDSRNPSLSDGTELNDSEYYFDTLSVGDSDEIELNTTEGNIDIGVRRNIELANGATLNVTGDGVVRVFVDGDSYGGTYHLDMTDPSEILTPGDNAVQFRVYGKQDFKAQIGASGGGNLAKFVGVLYAPPGRNGDAEIKLGSGEVYGGMLTGTTIIEKGSIHYDETLREKQVIPPDANQIKVTFLHVTVNEVAVEG